MVLTCNDNGDWVDNINALIAEVNTDYFRILPHDDSATGESSALLINALDNNPDCILASGVVRAENLDGVRIPGLDELNLQEIDRCAEWTISDALTMF